MKRDSKHLRLMNRQAITINARAKKHLGGAFFSRKYTTGSEEKEKSYGIYSAAIDTTRKKHFSLLLLCRGGKKNSC